MEVLDLMVALDYGRFAWGGGDVCGFAEEKKEEGHRPLSLARENGKLTGVTSSTGTFVNLDVYYEDRELVDGLRELKDKDDYVRFLDATYSNDGKISIYNYHAGEDIMEWIEEQKAEEGDSGSETCEDDVDSVLSDDVSVDHEVDDEVIQILSSVDHFLSRNNLIPAGGVGDKVEDSVPKFPIHDPNQKWDTLKPVLGMRFSDRYEVKQMLTNYAVFNGYELYYEKNESSRLLVRCCKNKEGKPGCSFRLWATPMSSEDSYQIKSLVDEHNCCRKQNLGSIVTYRWIGKMLINDILDRPRLSFRKMRAEVRTRFGLNVSVGQCRNAKAFALDEISGSLNGHYEKLWMYGAELVWANPGSTVKIQVDPMPDSIVYFSRMYVCFKGVKDGWIEGCRRVIGIDGCFLKGICRGELLSAIGRDANNQMYPLAWAVVSVENKDTWKWFIDLLLNDIDMGNGAGLTFISDQHKGLVEAVKERAPASEHRQCVRHIYANFKKSCSSTSDGKRKRPKHMVQAFFEPDRCCDAVENGISESFNAAIVEASKKPIITMLEEIRVYVMERMYRQKVKGDKWELDICPSIRRKIEKNKEIQRYWEVTPSGPEQYEVKKAYEQFFFFNGNPEDYVAVWFQTKVFSSCYRYTIKPINGADMWPNIDAHTIFPPRRRRLPGRPKVSRKKCPSEKEGRHTVTKKGVVPKCGNCHQSGHNKRRCPLLNPVAPDQSLVAEEEQPDPVPVAEEEVEADQEEADHEADPDPVPVEEEADHVGVSKRRRPSERITKLKLRKNVVTPDGSGGSNDNPVNLN
ncbi:hypothetical protein LXL04_039646 [Taraxacum kok-saghyz]